MRPLVSILIPAYNAERWIKQTIASAVRQDYPNKEVILVNDGSSDRTLEIAKAFESSSVKVINQENVGGPGARNNALKHAQGDYIQWLDHDDLLAPNKISEQIKVVESIGSDRILLSGSFGTFYFRSERARFEPGEMWRDLSPLEYFYAKFEQDEWIHTTCWLVSRKLTEAAGPWWDIRSPDDDGEYFCRVVASSDGMRFVPAARSFWRIGNDASFSYTGQRSVKSLSAMLKTNFRCIEHFRALDDSERCRTACVTFLRNRLIYYYPDHREMLKDIYDLAERLGGTLSTPPLQQYEVLRPLIGWRRARWIQELIGGAKQKVYRALDKMIYDCARDKLSSPGKDSHYSP